MNKKYMEIEIDYSRDSMFDELGLKRLRESYMKDDEGSPQERFAFVSKSFGSNIEHSQRLYEYSSKHWLSYSTPILSYGRTKYGLPISCFLSWIPDTAKGLVDTLSETNWLSMLGGGVGLGFGIRSASDKSTGVMPHLKTYDASSLAYKQGNTRRGSYAAYLDISHPDIMMFLDIRKPTGDQNMRCLNLHHGINIPDSFMDIIERSMVDPATDDSWELKDPHNGNVKEVVSAKEIWQKIIELRVQTGEPYLHFIDTSNRELPDFLKRRGLKIRQSNLCVSGDQRVPTSMGIMTAKELYENGSELILASNDGPVKSTPMKLVERDAETFKVSLENGMTHTITKYHKLLSRSGRSSVIKSLSDLSVGDYIAVQTNEGVFGSVDMQREAFLLGMYHGDGTQSNSCKTIHFDIWENDFDLSKEIESCIDYIYQKYGLNISNSGKNQFNSGFKRYYKTPRFTNCYTKFSNVKKKRLSSSRLSEVLEFKKGFIPSWIWSGTKETQWSYIRGLLYTDGTAFMSKSKGNPIQISIASIDKSHLKEIQIILANLGIQTSIRILRSSGLRKLPDGKGGFRDYSTQDCYRIIIGNKNDAIKIENFTNFLTRKNILIENKAYRDNTKKFYKISSIESVGKQDVYCVGVHTDQHLWICNGVVTHNCAEILLPTSEDRTAVCCLSSLNIEKYDEWKDDNLFLKDVAEMLDNVLSIFISNAPQEISRAKFSATRERSIGVGALGFHAYLQKNNIPFESALAKSANIRIFKKIRNGLESASEELARERGEAPDAEGTGKRFSLLMAVAPNASSSILMGNTSPSIEPFKANCYRQDTLSGAYMNKNKYLDMIIKSKSEENKKLDYGEIWSSIISNNGSVQHLDILDDWQKSVFKTAIEIDQRWIIEHASDRQQFIDQGQSINLFFKPDSNIKYLHATHFLAWKKGLKTLYYCRSEKIIKADKVSQKIERNIIDEIDITKIVDGVDCLACEG